MNTDCPQRISVSALADGELPDRERASLIRHLGECEICRQELDDLEKLRGALAGLTADHGARRRVLEKLSRSASAVRLTQRRLAIPFPVAAAVLLLLGISVFGNAYLSLRQRTAPVPGGLPGAGAQITAPGPVPGKAETGKPPAAKAFVVTLEAERKTIRYVGDTDYRPYAVPRIYAGGILNPSEER